MREKQNVVIVGLGEVGNPLFDLISKRHNTVGVDISRPLTTIDHVDVLHVCYPFQIIDFVGETVRYIGLFKPTLTIINSTVAVGTTRLIAERTGAAVVNSPIRGKHARMLEELSEYIKFIGAIDSVDGRRAADHFESVGLTTKLLSSPEATELAKLTETTYFGLMIAWAQEIERYCDQSGTDYNEIASFYDEINFFPSVRYFPGIIGGHCVIPNIAILRKMDDSALLKAIECSNQRKITREAGKELARARPLTKSIAEITAASADSDAMRFSQ